MNSKRVIFLLLAVIVAGATAFLARAWLQSEREALIAQAGLHRTSPSAPTLQVLVAKQNIRVGQLIKPDTLRWQAWPAGNLSPSYIVEGKHKEQEFVGAVVRSSIAVGQLIKPDTLRWQAWPAGNLSPSYIVEGKHKEQEFVGAVVRSSIAVGEPI